MIELKEVKYRPGIDDHDFDTKTRHARRFLEEKNKVKVTMMFRGRQVAHPELGQAVLDRVAATLADVGEDRERGPAGREVDDDDSRAEMKQSVRHAENEDHKGATKRFKVTGTGKVQALQGVQEPHPHQEDLEAEAPPAPRRHRRHERRQKRIKRLLQA